MLEVGEQVKTMYFEQSQKTTPSFLMEAIEIANKCDLSYKISRNQRLLVELCLMQLASLTLKEEKKNGNRHVIPPSFFKTDAKPSASSPESERPSSRRPLHLGLAVERIPSAALRH